LLPFVTTNSALLPRGPQDYLDAFEKLLKLALKDKQVIGIWQHLCFASYVPYIGAVSALVLYIEISLATSSQEREIVRVLVDCCLQEKAYNPYYAHLGAKFCHYSYNHKVCVFLVFGAKFCHTRLQFTFHRTI
jgi:nucleolar MIF4G domain-containing protein 1